MTSRDGMSALKLVPRQGTNANTDSANVDKGSWRAHADPEDFILEGWAQGFMVGALIIMACITIANMRRGVILHKLVLLEVCTLECPLLVKLTERSSNCLP